MSNLEIHSGDFLSGHGDFMGKAFLLRTMKHRWLGEKIPASQLVDLSVVTEDMKRTAGSLGWAAAATIAAGPIGTVASLLISGKKKKITFIAKLRDGRKFMATADNKTFIQIQALLV